MGKRKLEFICHTTDREIKPKTPIKGRIYKSTIIHIDNGKYFVNDIQKSEGKTSIGLIKAI